MNPPYIPATALSGDLVRDWTGPADGQRAERWLSGILVGQASDGRLLWTPARGIVVPERVRLDPRRPEVAHRIAAVLRARGHEVGHFLPVALGGKVESVDVSAALLVACVAGVEAGAGVVRGLMGEWAIEADGRPRRRGLVGSDVGTVVIDDGWAVWSTATRDRWGGPTRLASGPETGAEGRAAADAALLRLGYAYLDSSAPFGVRVPFTSSSKEAAEGR